MKFETKAIHGVRTPEKGIENWGSTLNMATTFPIKTYSEWQEFEYSRVSNPTRKDFETMIALLENGKHGFGFSSGMAATSSVFTMFEAGDHFVLSLDIYGGTYRIINDIFNKFGFEATFVDTTDLQQIEAAVRPNTKAIFIETPSNPLLEVTDIRGVVAIAKRHNLLSMVDNTFMSPVLQRPLELGADDYVTKPFSNRELIARVKANLRRNLVKEPEPQEVNKNEIVVGDLVIHQDAYIISKHGEEIELTHREFELLHYLARHIGQVMTREHLLETVWDYDYFGDVRTVDVTIRRLREKIEDIPSHPTYIVTRRGVGYLLKNPDQE